MGGHEKLDRVGGMAEKQTMAWKRSLVHAQPALQRFSSCTRRTEESDGECGRKQRGSPTTANVEENRHANAGMDLPSAMPSVGSLCLNNGETIQRQLIEQMEIVVLRTPWFTG